MLTSTVSSSKTGSEMQPIRALQPRLDGIPGFWLVGDLGWAGFPSSWLHWLRQLTIATAIGVDLVLPTDAGTPWKSMVDTLYYMDIQWLGLRVELLHDLIAAFAHRFFRGLFGHDVAPASRTFPCLRSENMDAALLSAEKLVLLAVVPLRVGDGRGVGLARSSKGDGRHHELIRQLGLIPLEHRVTDALGEHDVDEGLQRGSHFLLGARGFLGGFDGVVHRDQVLVVALERGRLPLRLGDGCDAP